MTGLGKIRTAGWEFQAQFETEDPSKGLTGAGYVLKDLSHDAFKFARDVRIERIFLKSGGSLPQEVSFSLGSSAVTQVTPPQRETPPGSDPRGYFAPKIALSAGYKYADAFGAQGQDVMLTQRYLLTAANNQPAHEPSGQLKSTRLYPLLEITLPPFVGFDTDSVIEEIRVDYRIEFALDSLKTKVSGYVPSMPFPGAPMGQIHKSSVPTGTVGPNQAGLWRDRDDGPSGLDVTGVFAAAEKPLMWEVIGQGITKGVGDKWDNVHHWPRLPNRKQPATPGMPHGLHHHWRWFPAAADPPFPYNLALPGAGPQLEGISGPGSVMIDPAIQDQDLRFAITKTDLITGALSAYPNNGFDDFDALFTQNPWRPNGPDPINQGADLVHWYSFTIRRPKVEGPAPFDVPQFGGTLFVHGMFFAHESFSVWVASPIPTSPKGATQEQYIKTRPAHKWVR